MDRWFKMTRLTWMVSITAFTLILAACGAGSEPSTDAAPVEEDAASGAEDSGEAAESTSSEWDELVAAAEEEGVVRIMSHHEPQNEAVFEAFEAAFPDIRVDAEIGNTTTDLVPRALRERESGLYDWDIYTGGAGACFENLEPAGALVPFSELHFRDDVADDSSWYGGFHLYPTDVSNTQYCFVWRPTLWGGWAVNRDVVPEDELTSAEDLITTDRPIVGLDISRGGAQWAYANLYERYGEDYMRRFFSEQEFTQIDDNRLQMEWFATGRFPVTIPVHISDLVTYEEAGVIENFDWYDQTLVFRTVGAFADAPNPNATQVFLNWFLSAEGQQAANDAFENAEGISRRNDVIQRDPRSEPDWDRWDEYSSIHLESSGNLRQEAVAIYEEETGG